MALSALMTTGCAMSIPDTTPYVPSASEPLPGASLCSRTETAARSLASSQAAGGWVFASLGVAATGGGAIATLVNVQEGRRIAGTAITLGGVALGAVAYVLFMRSAASSRLAQAANMAMLERDDHHAWDSCVRAKAAWSGSKGSADAVTAEMLAQRERENKKLEEQIEELKKKAGEPSKPELPPPLAPRR
ncbi:Hypothetical protein A7982_04828 [Minicystis rosea]|nr:Hypothetical protein A7982_04828 [Minicystis rosea]